MPLLGAHLSIAGGYHKAVEAAAAFGMECVQLFTKNNNQWRAKPLTEEDVACFREAHVLQTGAIGREAKKRLRLSVSLLSDGPKLRTQSCPRKAVGTAPGASPKPRLT